LQLGTLAEAINLVENKAYSSEDGAIALIERIWCFEGTQFTCFTSTKVQILTDEEVGRPLSGAGYGVVRRQRAMGQGAV
jgi:hypothetical protein